MRLSKNKNNKGDILSYRIGLKKTEIEKHNLQDCDFLIDYTDNNIILTKKQQQEQKRE